MIAPLSISRLRRLSRQALASLPPFMGAPFVGGSCLNVLHLLRRFTASESFNRFNRFMTREACQPSEMKPRVVSFLVAPSSLSMPVVEHGSYRKCVGSRRS